MDLAGAKVQTKSRNYGIDLLKLLSMLMIVLLHVLGMGGVLEGLQPGTRAHDLMWLLEIACYGAVNGFALTTGYLMVDSSAKYHRLISLWLQVVFYTMGITLFFQLWRPEAVSMLNWKAAWRPVMAKQYWYFTAYFAMYLFIPFYNKLINCLSREEFRRLLAAVFLLVILGFWAKDDIFRLQNGYTMMWLTMLYFIGAYFKRYPMRKGHPIVWSLGYLLAVGCTWGCKMASVYLEARSIGPTAWGWVLVSYTSPTVLLASIFLFLFCVYLPVKRSWMRKLVGWFSPAAFGVYLIHCHPLIWHQLLTGRFGYFISYPVPKLAAAVLFTGFVIWMLCLLIDRMRIAVFRLLQIDRLSRQITSWVGRRIEPWMKREV